MQLQSDLNLPEAHGEHEDPHHADQVYATAAAYLREQTRDRTRFPLVFGELCSYGFRRNLWGLKPLGLLAVCLGLAVTIGALALHLRGIVDITLPPLVAGIVLQLAFGFIWTTRITPDWPKAAAFAYADALIATVESL